MRRARATVILVFLLLAGLGAAALADELSGGITASYEDLLAHRINLTLGDERIVELPLTGLMPGSERLLLEGTPMEPGRDYRLDPIRGRLELTRAAPGSRLELRADRRPWGLPRMLNQAPFRSWQEIDRGLEDAEAARREESPRHEIGAPPSVSRGSFRMGGSKSLVEQGTEGQAVLSFMSHLNQVGQTGSTPHHPKGLSTCCHGEEPHAVGWRFITERRAVNLDASCGWAQGKADVLYVADAFEVITRVNELLQET